MRPFLFLISQLLFFNAYAQDPAYEFASFNRSLSIPAGVNSQRSAVIFSVPDEVGDVRKVGDYEAFIEQAHRAFTTMKIDAVLYLNNHLFSASTASKKAYIKLFNKRKVKSLIFLSKSNDGYEVMIAPYSGDEQLIKAGADVFFHQETQLSNLMLTLGKEIRRAEQQQLNFLIPEKPNYLDGVSIVENTLLQNYPGILRRSKLAIERFALLDTVNVAPESLQKIQVYNQAIRQKNEELESIVASFYPYEWEMIDYLEDEQLKRKRYQFVLRSISGPAKSVRRMLDYKALDSETAFASVIPVMPDQQRVKTLAENAQVHKFFIRQNISKNVHVGEWDADETWQDALNNMIGNLIQELNVDR